ncbi:MAG: amidophosphoribosyltransferase [Planctomycetes bacterium]|nr:amidophosphoribosyltransferase [Planctomycetota bacterium]
MCGIIGILGEGPVVADLYEGLHAIQHRGQDAAGIAVFGDKMRVKKGLGLVNDIFHEADLAPLVGNVGIAHVRYPTVGCGDVEDAQPFYTNSPFGISLAHNGNVTNFRELRAELASRDLRQVNSACDAEAILNVFASGLPTGDWRTEPSEQIFAAVGEVFRRVKGSYSVVAVIANVGLVGFRDPFGIKPLVLGERTLPSGRTDYCLASESVVLDMLEFPVRRNVKPGEAVWIDYDGLLRTKQVVEPNHHPCLFEFVYFARPDSVIDRISVSATRHRLGKSLADEWMKTGLSVDAVIPVPESARNAAMEMANALGVPYREGLVKNRYVGRTFIMPGQKQREQSIRRKLNPIRAEFEGKDVLLVDDSIVRGSTSRKIVQMARRSGARKVYFASCSPPLRYPCLYGIDMSTRGEFIARDRTVDAVCRLIEADHLIYLPLDALERAARADNPEMTHFCNACFSGSYPTGDVTNEMMDAIERERLVSQGALF